MTPNYSLFEKIRVIPNYSIRYFEKFSKKKNRGGWVSSCMPKMVQHGNHGVNPGGKCIITESETKVANSCSIFSHVQAVVVQDKV